MPIVATNDDNPYDQGDVLVGGRTYDVNVWTAPSWRHSLDSIRQMLIDTPTGKRVRLHEVADVQILPTPNIIRREGGSRRIDVQANVAGRDLASVAEEVQRRLQQVSFPLGYRTVLQGEYVELRKAQRGLALYALLAAAAIFLLLQLSFKSWHLATLSFLTLPRPWWAACWPPTSPAGSSRSAHSSASSRCSASRRAMES